MAAAMEQTGKVWANKTVSEIRNNKLYKESNRRYEKKTSSTKKTVRDIRNNKFYKANSTTTESTSNQCTEMPELFRSSRTQSTLNWASEAPQVVKTINSLLSLDTKSRRHRPPFCCGKLACVTFKNESKGRDSARGSE
ncbi:hypothetical protein RRG08_043923 [Elysia crispata]|uniref:Uncharacterized protein n=1 Tax=Elysia crispata TaxID=231223 RepID=A0AAE1CMY4_9GAST|nr:hypothetical protein RRG08_043923 [Elysia crispata]